MTESTIPTGILDDQANANAALREKLVDALTPGYVVEMDPDEADRAGAFVEDALSEAEASASTDDLLDALEPPLLVVEV